MFKNSKVFVKLLSFTKLSWLLLQHCKINHEKVILLFKLKLFANKNHLNLMFFGLNN